jgi:DNA mismatch repair protein MutS
MPKKQTEGMDALYYRHYQEQKAKSGEQTAILLQVGKFFEMYDSVDLSTGISRANVQVLAEVCGCSVEPSEKGRIFWGFPESSLPKFERMLVDAGYTVVVIVQVKDATDVVKSRTIDHISSPGTFWDADGGLAVRKDEQSMLGIYIEPLSQTRTQQWFLATTAFDVMTGKTTSTETNVTLIDGKPVLDSLQPFWSMYPPAELIVDWCSPTPPPKENDLRSLFPSFGKRIPIHIRQVDAKTENSITQDRLRLAFFAKVFKPRAAISLETFLDVGVYHFVKRSLFKLLEFVNDHNPSYLTLLHSHTIWTPEDNVLLGNAALEQLAMIATHAEKPNESLLFWLQKASTAMGKRILRERCLKPIAEIEELERRQSRIAELRSVDRSLLEQTLKGCADLPRLFRRFQLGRGTSADLQNILVTYEKASILLDKVKDSTSEPECSASLTIHVRSLLSRWNLDRLRTSMELSSDQVAMGSVHPWQRGVHADLDQFEDSWFALENEMLEKKRAWEELIKEADSVTWTLKEDQPFTFTLTARRAAALCVAAKKQRKEELSSSKRGSSTTVTLEASFLDVANEKARTIRSEWRARLQEHWAQDWSAWMSTEIENGMLDAIGNFLGCLDAECTLARVSDLYGYVRPTYVESTETAVAGLRIDELRHPIIERIHTETPYVSHNLALGAMADDDNKVNGASSQAGILLYGVNAAGKSSLGKALGLAVLMAQCGMPVPASAMTLIPYTGLFTRILGNDNLWAGMSSFVVEMTEFRSILRSADARTLVIGDELCGGTETASATAIVASGIETLAGRSSHFFFATHLHELSELPEIARHPAIAFYHLTVYSDVEKGMLVYDRQLRPGCGSPMYGLEVCRGLDMDRQFLARAMEIRKQYFSENGRAHASSYNPQVIVQMCEVCGSAKELETHHIVQQAAADSRNQIRPGKHKNSRENLVCLCTDCHTKHHRGLLEIQGWIQTTDGRKLKLRTV